MDDPREKVFYSARALSGVVALMDDAQSGRGGFESSTPESLYGLLSFIENELSEACDDVLRLKLPE